MTKTISDDEFYDEDYAERLPLLAESMMGNPRMAHDIRAAHEEVMRLRSLITAWADADAIVQHQKNLNRHSKRSVPTAFSMQLHKAAEALRAEAGR